MSHEGFIKRKEAPQRTEVMRTPEFGYDAELAQASFYFADGERVISFSLEGVTVTEPDKNLSILKGTDKNSGAEVVMKILEDAGTLEVIEVTIDNERVYGQTWH